MFKCYIEDVSGVTVVEYGILIALIALAVVGSLIALGESMTGTYKTIADTIESGGVSQPPQDFPNPNNIDPNNPVPQEPPPIGL